jgi:hypothetical protein
MPHTYEGDPWIDSPFPPFARRPRPHNPTDLVLSGLGTNWAAENHLDPLVLVSRAIHPTSKTHRQNPAFLEQSTTETLPKGKCQLLNYLIACSSSICGGGVFGHRRRSPERRGGGARRRLPRGSGPNCRYWAPAHQRHVYVGCAKFMVHVDLFFFNYNPWAARQVLLHLALVN